MAAPVLLFPTEGLVEILNRSHREANPLDVGVDVRLLKDELGVEHRTIGLALTVRSMIGGGGESECTCKCLTDASVMEMKPLVVWGDLLCFAFGWSSSVGWRLVGDKYLVMGDWERSMVTFFCFAGLPRTIIGLTLSFFIVVGFSLSLWGLADALVLLSFVFTYMPDDFENGSLCPGCKAGFLSHSSFFKKWSPRSLLLLTGVCKAPWAFTDPNILSNVLCPTNARLYSIKGEGQTGRHTRTYCVHNTVTHSLADLGIHSRSRQR